MGTAIVQERPGSVDLATTLRILLVMRVVIVTALLGSALFVQIFYGVTSDSLYFIIGITYLLTLFYSILTQPLRNSRTFIFTQLVVDVLIITVLVLVTGAIDSAFIFLYYLPVLTAAVALGRVSSLALAVLAALLFGLVAVAANSQLFDLSVIYPFRQPGLATLLYAIALPVTGLAIVAMLSGYLASVLQHTAVILRERTIDLQRLQLLNENIVRSIPTGILVTDAAGSIQFANPAAEALLETPTTELLGKDIYEFLQFNPGAPEVLVKGDRWSREMLLNAGEESRNVQVSRSYLYNRDTSGDEKAEKLYIIEDLKELKELRNRLQVRDRLATAGQMSAAMAHEVRNPLGAISGSAQMLQKSENLEEDQRYFMDIIVRESERLNVTLNNFLTFARSPDLNSTSADLCSAIRETLDLLNNAPQLSDRHTLVHELPPDAVRADVDINMYKQMLYNLVLNGVRAMPDGGMLRVTLQTDAENATLTVYDQGHGIHPQALEEVFKPFSSSSPGGTGLGLAIVYRIVQEHGGRLHVRSRENVGTSVAVLLPLHRGNPENFNVTVEAVEPEYGSHTDS